MDSTSATSSAQWATMSGEVTLRALQEADLAFLDRLSIEPDAAGVFIWSGYRDVRSRRKRWETDGYISADSVVLAITLAGAEGIEPIGFASWQTNPRHQPGACYEIGLTVLPEHRGRGLGTAAHQQLVSHLFRFTTAHRLEAVTDAENLPEQRALERAGFALEGRRRQVYFQFGTWRDELMYGLLRSERVGVSRSRLSVGGAGRSDHAPDKPCLRRLRDLRPLRTPGMASGGQGLRPVDPDTPGSPSRAGVRTPDAHRRPPDRAGLVKVVRPWGAPPLSGRARSGRGKPA